MHTVPPRNADECPMLVREGGQPPGLGVRATFRAIPRPQNHPETCLRALAPSPGRNTDARLSSDGRRVVEGDTRHLLATVDPRLAFLAFPAFALLLLGSHLLRMPLRCLGIGSQLLLTT